MLWFYRRERDTLRVETRFDNQTAEYVLIIHWPDGPHEERFSTHADFENRSKHWRHASVRNGRPQIHDPRFSETAGPTNGPLASRKPADLHPPEPPCRTEH